MEMTKMFSICDKINPRLNFTSNGTHCRKNRRWGLTVTTRALVTAFAVHFGCLDAWIITVEGRIKYISTTNFPEIARLQPDTEYLYTKKTIK